MRVLIALLAALAVLSSPMTVAAAQVSCSHGGPGAMAGMDMAGMPGMDQSGGQKPGENPCCDHSGKLGTSVDCAQACATICAVTAAMPSAPASLVTTRIRASAAPPRAAPTDAFEPSGLERPPKSMA